MVGFPGETEDDFEQLLVFLEEAQLDRVGCFTYSAVDGATANALADHVPEAVKEERKARLMALQEGISAARLARKIGKILTVLVDEITPEGAVARSAADAPEIDGQVYIDDAAGLSAGDYVTVEITDSDDHDLWAKRIVS